MSTFCPQIVECGWCNPYCSERIKINSLRELEKDWWNYGKNSRVVVLDYERIEDNKQVSVGNNRKTVQDREE